MDEPRNRTERRAHDELARKMKPVKRYRTAARWFRVVPLIAIAVFILTAVLIAIRT